jgi:hypothetical protein
MERQRITVVAGVAEHTQGALAWPVALGGLAEGQQPPSQEAVDRQAAQTVLAAVELALVDRPVFMASPLALAAREL